MSVSALRTDKRDTAAGITWGARMNRIGHSRVRMDSIGGLAHQIVRWSLDLPEAMQESDELPRVVKEADLVASATRRAIALHEMMLDALENDLPALSTMLEDWIEAVRKVSNQFARLLEALNAVFIFVGRRFGDEEAGRILRKERGGFAPFDRGRPFGLLAGLSVDERIAGKFLAEDRAAHAPQTETDRVRRARRRKASGFTRYFLDLHETDIEMMARLGLIQPKETDKAIIEAAAQVFLSAAFVFASTASNEGALLTVADRVRALNNLEIAD